MEHTEHCKKRMKWGDGECECGAGESASDFNALLGCFPLTDPGQIKRVANNDHCPECGGHLDTGWECNDCGYDAMHLAYTEIDKAREAGKK